VKNFFLNVYFPINIVWLALQVWDRNLLWETCWRATDCNVESCQYTVCCTCVCSKLGLFL